MKRKWIALGCCVLLALTAVGCSARKYASSPQEAMYDNYAPAPMAEGSYDSAYGAPMASTEPEMPAENTAWSGTSMEMQKSTGGYGGYKLIREAGLSLETRQFEDTITLIKDKVANMNGYISNSNVSGRKPETYADSGRYAHINIRIPQEGLDLFLSAARGIEFATVIDENTGSDDVTAAYFDTESRLEIYRTQQARTLALLEKAETMEDIIALETELSRLTYEIESLTTQLRRWDDLVNFATVSINISEIPPNRPIATTDTIGTRISEGIQRTWSAMLVFFENLIVYLIVISPVLLLLGVIALVTVVIVRARIRKKRKTRAKAQEEAQANMQAQPVSNRNMPPQA